MLALVMKMAYIPPAMSIRPEIRRNHWAVAALVVLYHVARLRLNSPGAGTSTGPPMNSSAPMSGSASRGSASIIRRRYAEAGPGAS